MKIKKIFGLATVASLALLMTACGKTKGNETILDEDYFNIKAVDLASYKESIQTKTKIEELCKDKKYVGYQGSILVLKDENKYYFYNLALDGKCVVEVDYSDYYGYNIYQDYGYIKITYKTNEDYDYGYALYTYDGKCILEKTYCSSNISVSKNYEPSMYEDGKAYIDVTSYKVSYRTKEDGVYTSKNKTYYITEKISLTEYDGKEVVEYLTEEEFLEKYGKIRENDIDGKIYGLKGYTIKMAQTNNNGLTLFLFNGNTLVNSLTSSYSLDVVTDGYLLFQTTKNVSVSDDYDIYYSNNYQVVKTYKMNLKDSKVTEVKDFKYLISTANSFTPIVEDEQIKGYYCYVYDFSKDKVVDNTDLKMARIDGKGNITVHNAMTLNGNQVIKDDKEYYVYNIASAHSNINETTTVYDKNGKVKSVCEGIYYDGITAIDEIGRIRFEDKDGKTLLVLTDFVRIDLSKYYGIDALGKKILVEIKDGSITKTDITDYNIYDNKALTKRNGDNIEFYTLDSTLTSLGLSYDTTTETITSITNGFYRVTNSSTYDSKVIYFA